MLATLDELGRVGYGALRIEDVATLSGVNKTTIYRRWPNKMALVGAAIRDLVGEPTRPDTGSLREDLYQSLATTVFVSSPASARALLRVMQVEAGQEEVDELTAELREEYQRARLELLDRAVARGELHPSTNRDLLVETLMGTLYVRVIVRREPADEEFLRSLIDHVVTGAHAVAMR